MRSTEKILTTHTGSLPKPDGLVELIWAHDEGGEVDELVLRRRIGDAVQEVVDRQRAIGLDIVNDGEVSKSGFSTYIFERYDGFGASIEAIPQALDLADFPEMAGQLMTHRAVPHIVMRSCVAPIALAKPQLVKTDIANLTAALGDTAPGMAFMNAPTPGQVAFNNPNQYYASHREYLEAAADALRYEYQAIIDAGFNLQLDSPDLAMVGHYQFGPGVGEHMPHLEASIDAINRAIDGLPPERIRLHLCWGNYVGAHNHDVPLRDLIERVFRANVETISFEAANPSHQHEWEVFADVKLPADKVLMPGVVDVQTARLEHPRVVAQRIRRFTDLVGREQVIVGTDCGFETFAGWDHIPASLAWAKLKAIVDGAEIASAELW